MVRDPYAREDPPDPAEILAVLADEDVRTIIRTVEEPMTAQELQMQCDIPESTLYRKLERMTDVDLLSQRTRIRRDGRHTNEYTTAFESITIRRSDEDGSLAVTVTPVAKAADERLAELWSEVSREA